MVRVKSVLSLCAVGPFYLGAGRGRGVGRGGRGRGGGEGVEGREGVRRRGKNACGMGKILYSPLCRYSQASAPDWQCTYVHVRQ